MSMPASQTDRPQVPIGSGDIDFQLALFIKRATMLASAISGAAVEGRPLDGISRGKSLDDLRRDFERSLEGFREDLCIALTGREPPRGNVPALVAAVLEFGGRAPALASASQAA